MCAENLRAAKVVPHRLLHRIQRRRHALRRIRHHRRRHCRCASGDMIFRDLRQRLDTAFHRVAPERAVHVQIDQPGRHEAAGGIDHGGVVRPQHL